MKSNGARYKKIQMTLELHIHVGTVKQMIRHNTIDFIIVIIIIRHSWMKVSHVAQ